MLQNRSVAFLLMILAYVLAIAGAAWSLQYFNYDQAWINVLLADIVGTVIIYLISLVFKNSSFYDPYWSVAPIVIAFYLFDFGSADLRSKIVLSAVIIWGVRLTMNFLSGWTGLHHEDWRYVNLRKEHVKLFQLVNFTGIMLMPTILVFLGCLPFFTIMEDGTNPLGWLDGLAILLFLVSIYFETMADIQLRQFGKTRSGPDEILQSGLWSISRHPNYFGEIMFWWSMACFGLAASGFVWWHYLGAASITALFVFISVPLIEERMLRKRPHYKEVQKRIPAIVPWPQKKG